MTFVRGVHSHIITDLFLATYDELELVLLATAWKIHDALIKVVVRIHNAILIDLASNST